MLGIVNVFYLIVEVKNKLERGFIKLGREYWVEKRILEFTNWVNQ